MTNILLAVSIIVAAIAVGTAAFIAIQTRRKYYDEYRRRQMRQTSAGREQ